MVDVATVVGVVAGVASTVSFVPQAWKIIRTRETKAISIGMYTITVCAFALWLAYGFMLSQWPLVASNGICFILSGLILGMKLFGPSKDEPDEERPLVSALSSHP